MKAMVLAAGKGTRLFPLTGVIPKPMAPVVGKPVIQHILELLSRGGVQESYINIHYLAEVILACYGQKSQVDGMVVNFTREERLMGTAGGVKRVAACFKETFIVVMGDALTDVDVGDVVAFHREHGALATLALRRVEDTSNYGVVELDAQSRVLSFQEKPHPSKAVSKLANTGIYVLEPEILEYIPKDTFFDFAEDVFPRLLEAGERVVGYEGEFYWSDIGTLESYRAAQRDVLLGKVQVRIPGKRWGEIWVDREARLHPTARLEGPIVLMKNAIIERGATLSGDTTVGSGCWIRPEATIKRSILFPGATVGDGAYLEECIVGPYYEVRAGEQIRGGALICGGH